ncbi:MAG: hypothetical protein WDZ69_02855 [Candidatus Pacearchaeota archaeon]
MRYGGRSKVRGLFMFLYILFAIYFLNYPFNFINFGDAFSSFEPWIIFIGGILLVFGGFSFFRRGRVVY